MRLHPDHNVEKNAKTSNPIHSTNSVVRTNLVSQQNSVIQKKPIKHTNSVSKSHSSNEAHSSKPQKQQIPTNKRKQPDLLVEECLRNESSLNVSNKRFCSIQT